MTSVNAPPSPPPNNRLRLALMASLALNVLIIGAVAGTLLMSRHQGWKGHRGKHSVLVQFAQTLPADRAEVIRAKVASEEATLAPLRQAERDARVAARAILMQDPFDVEKFKAALDRVAEADTKEKRARMSLLATTAAELTPDERRQLHAFFEKRRARFRRHRDEDATPPPPQPPPAP
jgi:uncharacterized membrane protein